MRTTLILRVVMVGVSTSSMPPVSGAEECRRSPTRVVRQRVMEILEKHPMARESDEYLWLLYIRYYCKKASRYIGFMPFEVIRDLPSFETIRRRRQEIQNDMGLYLPREETLRRRIKLSKGTLGGGRV